MLISPFQVLLASFIPLLFVPAGLLLLVKTVTVHTIAERLIVIALALFCPETAYMAYVDLKNILTVSNQLSNQLIEEGTEDPRLGLFYKVAASTIVLEATGLYTALLFPQAGAVVVIASQVWFNLLAKVQLSPSEVPAITSFGIYERRPVLIANAVGLSLLLLWPIDAIRVWLAAGLLFLVILFLIIKYGPRSLSSRSSTEDCPVLDKTNSDRT